MIVSIQQGLSLIFAKKNVQEAKWQGVQKQKCQNQNHTQQYQ